MPSQDELNLRLNNPPSFRNPKSVLVIGLPPVKPSPTPPLRSVDATQIFCAGKPSLLLPAEGAPLVFATELAHDFVLHVDPKTGAGIDVPAKADPMLGGFVVDTQALQAANLDGEVSGTLRGSWGYHPFEGPHYRLRTSRPAQWVVASKDASALIVGREDILHLQSPDACCVSDVTVKNDQGKSLETSWKASKPDELEVKVPLQTATAGSVTMVIKKFGLREADEIPFHTYAEAGRLDSFSIHAGDAEGVLKGTRLDQVNSLEVDGLAFKPGALSRANQQDELMLAMPDAAQSAKLHPGDSIVVHVSLKDGRILDLKTEVAAPRPKVSMLTKSIQVDQSALGSYCSSRQRRRIASGWTSNILPQDASACGLSSQRKNRSCDRRRIIPCPLERQRWQSHAAGLEDRLCGTRSHETARALGFRPAEVSPGRG